jgi:N-hydroxyarylamine O-acetyltransferase
MFNWEAYRKRIGYSGAAEASLEALRRIHLLHPAAIPFENLNPLMGWPVLLDVGSVQNKLVEARRGGWCFEQNKLFGEALSYLGFAVTGLGARVVWNAPAGTPIGARSHMLLRVEAEGTSLIADVGFGGNVLTTPLRLESGRAQDTPHGVFRLTENADHWLEEVLLQDEWQPLYEFTLEPQFPADYEVSNWYLCHHPSSFFRTTLVAARAFPGKRLGLRNTELSIHTPGGSEKRIIEEPEELRACLANDMGIALPESEELNQRLAALFTGMPTAPVR